MSNDTPQKDARMARFRSLASYLVDAIALPLSAALTTYAGLRVAKLLDQWMESAKDLDQQAVILPAAGLDITRGWLLASVSVAGAGVLIKATLELLGSLPVITAPALVALRERKFRLVSWAQIGGSAVTLVWDQWKIMVSLFGLTASIGVTISQLPPARDAGTRHVVAEIASREQLRVTIGEQTFELVARFAAADVGRAALMVLFEEETQPEKRPFVAGLEFAGGPNAATALDTFAKRMAYCNRDGRRSVVVVRGFASSSGSDKDNLDLANARAERVRQFLTLVGTAAADDDGASLGRSIVEVQGWTKASDMKEARGYQDTAAGPSGVRLYSKNRGQLNRRAELVIEDAGACTK